MILERIRRGERIEHYETARKRKDGSSIVISLTVSPVKNGEGRIVGASKIARDITERKREEARERALMAELTFMNRAAAGELSASIAHELNQPLTGIVTRASAARRWLAAERLDIDKARAALDQIENAGHRAADIIRNVRAVFKKDTHEKLPVDVNRLILEVLSSGEIEFKKHQIEVHTDLDDRLPSVTGNRVQLQQVILNLVMNAIEAMHSAQPRRLHVQSRLSKPDVVHVSIEDTGTGIDPANVDRIFKPLFTTKAMAWEWVFPSVIRSSRATTGGSGCRRAPLAVQSFNLNSRPIDKGRLGTMAARVKCKELSLSISLPVWPTSGLPPGGL